MDIRNLFTLVHIFGVVFGAGGAFMSDIIFLSSIKDKMITPTETRFMKLGGLMVWIGLVILIISGVGLFALNPERYLASSKFLAKITIVGVIFVNGLFFHFSHIPRIVRHQDSSLSGSRKFMRAMPYLFASGAVSMVSWTSAIILGSLSRISFSYGDIMVVYLIVVSLGIVIAIQVGKYALISRR